jgi:hypothetical protein
MITLPLDTLRQRWANAWASAQPLLTRSLLWRRPAVCLWLALLLGVTVRVLVSEPHRGTVYPVYALAAQRWLAGESAYVTRADHNQPIYRYAPVVTPWFVPLSSLPEPLGSLLWRAVNLAVLAVGLSCWLRLVLPLTLSRRRQGLLLAVIAPLALGSVNNAQANVLVLGLLLIGTAAIARRGWWVAVLCLSLACWLKVYPVVLLALLLVLYPRQLAWRAAIVLPLLALTPFAFQSSTFVLEQYRDWLIQMRLDDRAAIAVEQAPRNWLLLWRVWWAGRGGIGESTLAAYTALQVVSGLAVAAWCAWGRYRAAWSTRRTLFTTFNLAVLWMLIVGPASESCTYILLAPTAAALFLDAWSERDRFGQILTTTALVLLLGMVVALAFPFGTRLDVLGVHALAGTLLAVVAASWPARRPAEYSA